MSDDILNAGTVPIIVPYGGLGVDELVAYTPICGGTSTTNPVQSVASLESAGYQLLSNGAGALPTFSPPGWFLLASTSISSLTLAADFNNLTVDYIAYKFIIQYMLPETDGTSLIVRLSTDNGSTFISSAGAYSYRQTTNSGSFVDVSSSSATEMRVTTNTGNTATSEGLYGEFVLWNPMFSTRRTVLTGLVLNRNSTAGTEISQIYGQRLNGEENNAVRFVFLADNIAQAEIRMYGLTRL